MASALMAFVQGLAAEQAQETKAQDVAKDDDLFVDSDQKEAPKTLLDVARAQQEDVRPATSLLAVAQQQQQQQQQAQAQTTKETLAAQVDQEDEQHRREAVHKTLEAVAKEVRDERQQETSQAVAAALKEAAAEQYAADEFEAEEDGERVLAAAKSLVQQKQQQSEEEHEYDEDDDHHDAPAKPKAAIRKKKPAQKQPKSAPRTIRGQLSVFQCRQLTLTQRRLLLATLADDGDASGKQKKARAVNMEAINELAKHRRQQQPVGRRAKAEFAKLDDNRHCRFRPRLKAGGGSRENQPSRSDDEDNGGGGGRSEDFVRRMEAAERARAEGLRRTREEKLYLARVKKECPACGSAQSYAELSQKRKKCPNCGVAYRSRIAWSAVADEFLARLETYVADRQRARSGPSAASEAPTADSKRPTWEQVRDEFLGRVQLDAEHRALSKAAIWKEVAAQWTFRPQISRRAQQVRPERC